jgi:4-hydroxy-3-methylbut-2-enyl diphosphate reductase
MKFTAAVAVLAGVMLPCDAFVVKPSHHHGASLKMSTTEDAAAVSEKIPSKKEDRLRFMKNKQFYRKGFKEVRDDVEKTMQEQFKSELVDDLKESNYVIERNGVKVYLAKVCSCCSVVV